MALLDRFGRGVAVVLLAGALVACAGDTPPVNTVPGVTPSLAWQFTRTADTLVLGLQDREAFYRLDDAVLVGPGGKTIAAREISRHDTDQVGIGGPYGGVGVGVGGGARSGVGVGLSFPILNSNRGRDRRETDITFPVPGGGAGLAGWPTDWVVELSLVDNDGATSSATIPVPAP